MFDFFWKKFNHVSTGHEVEISYDEEGSCLVYTAVDVAAGSPLRMSYGDYYLTNPSATFGKYTAPSYESIRRSD